MAFTKQLSGIVVGENQRRYEWDIYSELTTDLSNDTNFETIADSFKFRWEAGSFQELYSPIVGSTFEMTLVADHHDTLNGIRDMATGYEGQTYIKIVDNIGWKWYGNILPEATVIEIVDGQTQVSIKFTDGLSLLKEVDFVDTDGSYYANSRTLLGWVYEVLTNKIPWMSEYPTTDTFLRESPFLQVLSDVYDPLDDGGSGNSNYTGTRSLINQYQCAPGAWTTVDTEEESTARSVGYQRPKVMTAHDVLEDILLTLGCRICWNGESWHIFSPLNYHDDSQGTTSHASFIWTENDLTTSGTGVFGTSDTFTPFRTFDANYKFVQGSTFNYNIPVRAVSITHLDGGASFTPDDNGWEWSEAVDQPADAFNINGIGTSENAQNIVINDNLGLSGDETLNFNFRAGVTLTQGVSNMGQFPAFAIEVEVLEEDGTVHYANKPITFGTTTYNGYNGATLLGTDFRTITTNDTTWTTTPGTTDGNDGVMYFPFHLSDDHSGYSSTIDDLPDTVFSATVPKTTVPGLAQRANNGQDLVYSPGTNNMWIDVDFDLDLPGVGPVNQVTVKWGFALFDKLGAEIDNMVKRGGTTSDVNDGVRGDWYGDLWFSDLNAHKLENFTLKINGVDSSATQFAALDNDLNSVTDLGTTVLGTGYSVEDRGPGILGLLRYNATYGTNIPSYDDAVTCFAFDFTTQESNIDNLRLLRDEWLQLLSGSTEGVSFTTGHVVDTFAGAIYTPDQLIRTTCLGGGNTYILPTRVEWTDQTGYSMEAITLIRRAAANIFNFGGNKPAPFRPTLVGGVKDDILFDVAGDYVGKPGLFGSGDLLAFDSDGNAVSVAGVGDGDTVKYDTGSGGWIKVDAASTTDKWDTAFTKSGTNESEIITARDGEASLNDRFNSLELPDMGDVDATVSTATTGETLVHDGTNFKATRLSVGDLDETQGAFDDAILQYDTTNGWEMQSAASIGSSINLPDLGDVDGADTPATGEVLKYNANGNGKWAPAPETSATLAIDDLTDVQIGNAVGRAQYDLIEWDGTSDYVGVTAADFKRRIEVQDLAEFDLAGNPGDGDSIVYSGTYGAGGEWTFGNPSATVATLNDVGDVTITTSAAYNCIMRNLDNDQWINVTPATIAGQTDLDDHSDVIYTTTAADDFLVRNGANTAWVNTTPASVGALIDSHINLSNLGDVSITGLATNDVLQWNGTNWVPKDSGELLTTAVLTDISNVAPVGATSGDVLTYNGASWAPVAPSGGATVDNAADSTLYEVVLADGDNLYDTQGTGTIGFNPGAAAALTYLAVSNFSDSAQLNVASGGLDPAIDVQSVDATATYWPAISIHRNSSTPADNDSLGGIDFKGEDSASVETTYARIESIARDVTNGTEDGGLNFGVSVGGTLTNAIEIVNDDATPTTTLYNLGSSSKAMKVENVAGTSGMNVEFDCDMKTTSTNTFSFNYVDAAGDARNFLRAEDAKTVINNRTASSSVEIRSNDTVAGASGEFTNASFKAADGGTNGDLTTIYGDHQSVPLTVDTNAAASWTGYANSGAAGIGSGNWVLHGANGGDAVVRTDVTGGDVQLVTQGGVFVGNSMTDTGGYTLPGQDGTANQQLKTDGNGNVSWFTPKTYPVYDFEMTAYNSVTTTTDLYYWMPGSTTYGFKFYDGSEKSSLSTTNLWNQYKKLSHRIVETGTYNLSFNVDISMSASTTGSSNCTEYNSNNVQILIYKVVQTTGGNCTLTQLGTTQNNTQHATDTAESTESSFSINSQSLTASDRIMVVLKGTQELGGTRYCHWAYDIKAEKTA